MVDKSADSNFNPLFFTMVIICLCGCLFLLLKLKEINAGAVYTFLLLAGIAILVLFNTWLKDEDKLTPITDFLRVNIGTGLRQPAILYLIGLGIPILIKLVIVLTTIQFSITSFSIPLLASDISKGFQSFSAAEVSSSISWQEFIGVYVAGTDETLLFNMIFPFAMALIGLFIFKMFTDEETLWFIPKKWFVVSFSFVMTALVFMTLHSLNETYVTAAQFMFAFAFILIANISIYVFGVGLMFWIGFHQMNNFMYIIETQGLANALSGLLGIFGFIFVGSIALLLYYLLRNKGDNTVTWWKSK